VYNPNARIIGVDGNSGLTFDPERLPLPDDFNLRQNLYCMSTARALIENVRPTRARSGVARTLILNDPKS
jgi:hypothetical protein